MALDYRLDLQADIKPADLLTKITESTCIPMVQDNVLQDSQSHFTVSAYKVSDKWIVEECEKEHGFKPSNNKIIVFDCSNPKLSLLNCQIIVPKLLVIKYFLRTTTKYNFAGIEY